MRNYDDFNITDARQGAALTVKIVPKANKNEIVGIQTDGALKIRLMAPPVEGQANEELIKFLAAFFEVKPEDIEIVAGVDSRKKLVSIMNVQASEIEKRLKDLVPQDLSPQDDEGESE
ncbi:MAG: YggU family protein [Chloroflexi bacterium]|nr:YggU family protein [Chloroflexota bacterium]